MSSPWPEANEEIRISPSGRQYRIIGYNDDGIEMYATAPITPLPSNDPAAWMLDDDFTSTPVEGIYRASCYICRDPEFAQMGLPLCYPCPKCGGHVAADDTVCDDCGHDCNPADYDID